MDIEEEEKNWEMLRNPYREDGELEVFTCAMLVNGEQDTKVVVL